jgi:hypothetical protein
MKNYILLLILFPLLHTACQRHERYENISKYYDAKSATEIKKYENEIDSLISLLPEMNTDTLDCRADIYWKIIKRGKASIPFLIENLTNTTETNIRHHCKNTNLNIGEVCYFALQELSEFPEFMVTKIQFDIIDVNGCWNFYEYLFDDKNKAELQKKVRDFYTTNQFEFKKIDDDKLNECHKRFQIEGKYYWINTKADQ